MARLGDLCDILNGYAFKSEQYVGSGIRIIRIANVQKGYIEDSTPVFYPIDNNEYKKYELMEGDLLLSLTGNVGRVALLQKEFLPAALNQRVACLRIKDETILSKSFLFNFLNSDYFENKCIESAKGVAQKNMSTEWLKEYDIPLLAIEKQEKISKELDQISNLIFIRKQQLSKLDELVKARFVELFGDPVVNPKSWETAPLSALIINANNGMARRGKDVDGSIVLRLVELQNGFIDYSAPNRICLNETEKKRYELVDNDFLFARVNGNPDYVGRCAVFKSIDEPVFHNDHIIRVHFDEAKINGCFMSVLLNSDYGKSQMREQIKTSAGQYTISQDGIGAIIAILPPLELQNQFAAFVEQTDKSKSEIQKSLEKLETLKKALMQKYFG
ncbi:MAG: restriction endonuclease subunit S [Clostridia bacterium]|nr:restriction endonuclease subunit S [Clostridia bacterium]